MKNKIIKNKRILSDLVLNILSFAIYIIAQQIILMPIMSNSLNEGEFSKLVIYLSLFSIITNSIGNELGITRQIKDDIVNGNVYRKLLLHLLPIIFIISMITLLILNFSVLNSLIFTLVMLMANVRLYALAYFRLIKDFRKGLIQNILYLIGMIVGLILYKYIINFVWLPLILAEVIPLIYSLIKTDLIKPITDTCVTDSMVKTRVIKTFKNLFFISLLVNAMTYFDKILIYPILGAMAVNIYYATNSMSKVVSLITNPLHGVILSWLKSNDNKLKKKAINVGIKSNIPIAIITFLLSLPITYFAVSLLYPQYLQEAKSIIVIISIGLGFSVASSLTKAILLKYMKSSKLVIAYILYFIIFVVLAIPASKYFGIKGFACANMISKFILWIQFILLLKKCQSYNLEEIK